MAYEIPGFSWTLPAAADLSASQFCFVDADNTAAGSRAALVGAGARAIGVLQNKPNAAGIAATIFTSGVSKVKAGAAVTAGANVKADASGRAILANAGSYALGIALASAGGANELIPVLLTPSGGGGLIA